MIGDNLKSDILGANTISENGVEWFSIAVKTGIYQGEESEIKPKKVVKDF